jgi:hypothetical protein
MAFTHTKKVDTELFIKARIQFRIRIRSQTSGSATLRARKKSCEILSSEQEKSRKSPHAQNSRSKIPSGEQERQLHKSADAHKFLERNFFRRARKKAESPDAHKFLEQSSFRRLRKKQKVTRRSQILGAKFLQENKKKSRESPDAHKFLERNSF